MDITSNDRTWGTFIHLGGIIGQALLSPVGNLIGALVLWLAKKNDSAYLDQQGKEAVNFQITISIMLLAVNIVTGIYWGAWSFGRMLRGSQVWDQAEWTIFSSASLGALIGVINLIFSILGAIDANNGKSYHYPISWRVVK